MRLLVESLAHIYKSRRSAQNLDINHHHSLSSLLQLVTKCLNPNEPKLSFKVVINKQQTKVLFAEANKDFVDVLLSFLTLPLGKLATVLRTHDGETAAPEIGSLTSLYVGFSNLDDAYFSSPVAKKMLLNPQSSLRDVCSKLAIDITDSTPPNHYFLCEDENCPSYEMLNIGMYSDIATCDCGEPLNREIRVGRCIDARGFTINPSSFIITDDLCVVPITGVIQTLNNLGNADTQGAEMVVASFGINEIRDLLKFSMSSATPLTDTLLKNSSTLAQPESEILLHHIQKDDDANPRKIFLKLCLQKSTNQLLFAVATDEFVELLSSFLTVSVGGAEFLLGGNTGVKSIDNLYRSVSNGIDDKYFTAIDTKNRLINPKLAYGFISENQFLPLSGEGPPQLYSSDKWNDQRHRKEVYFHGRRGTLVSSFKLNKGDYVKKQTMYIVSDDLTVSPSLSETISIFKDLGIAISDVKEMELHIGLDEALRLLKASLTSKTAFTDALVKPMLNKRPKPEP